jgi:hypothetical protein
MADERASPTDDASRPIAEPEPAMGALGGLMITGDRTLSLAVDREVDATRFTLGGPNGRIGFEGQPATISRLQVEGLEFYLEPDDCVHAPGERDPDSGLASLEVTCADIVDLRGSATVTAQGTLLLPGELLGLRGDLPQTGGEVSIGEETLAFSEASLDLRRPEVIETRPGFTTRNPTIYPVSIAGDDGRLTFEYNWELGALRLIEVELDGIVADVDPESCIIDFQVIGDVSPRASTGEMVLDCALASSQALGVVRLVGSLVVDVIALPSRGLQ